MYILWSRCVCASEALTEASIARCRSFATCARGGGSVGSCDRPEAVAAVWRCARLEAGDGLLVLGARGLPIGPELERHRARLQGLGRRTHALLALGLLLPRESRGHRGRAACERLARAWRLGDGGASSFPRQDGGRTGRKEGRIEEEGRNIGHAHTYASPARPVDDHQHLDRAGGFLARHWRSLESPSSLNSRLPSI